MIILGTAFFVHYSIIESAVDFGSTLPRLSIQTLRRGNKQDTVLNAHAPIKDDNTKNPEKIEEIWSQLRVKMFKI